MGKLNDLLHSIILKINAITSDYVKHAELPVIPTQISAFANDKGYLTEETDPTVPAWAKAANRPVYTASEVGADAQGTASNLVTAHNTGTDAHNDIRLLIANLADKLNKFLNVSDTATDELSEVLDLINNNKGTLESLTTSKVNILDIVNNLTTNVSNKPLSAAQGVALKALIDAITVPTKVSQLTNDAGYLTQHQDLSAYAKTVDVNSLLSKYATAATVTALQTSLETRIKALEDALNGFSFSDGTSAPTSAGTKHITFVDLS